jgi:integrase
MTPLQKRLLDAVRQLQEGEITPAEADEITREAGRELAEIKRALPTPAPRSPAVPSRARLTKRSVETLPTPTLEQGERVVWDAELPGFGVRLLPTGCRTFILQRRTRAGRSIRLKIGRVGDLSCDQARDEARRLISRITLGEDPAEQRRRERMAERQRRQAPTVAMLAEEWLRHGRTKQGMPWRNATREAYARAVEQRILPAIGRMRVENVERRHVRAILEPLADRPVAANRTLAAVRAMFGHAVRSDDWPITVNPAVGIGMHREEKRERYPQNGELERLVAALQRRDDRIGRFLMLLLLTGARRGELLAMRWPDVDLAAGIWTKPATTTKQRRSHRLPLNQEAVAILREIREVEPFSPFGRLRLSAIRAAWSEVLREAGIGDLHLHDLRHFHASLLASMGLSLPVIGALLGHASHVATQRYAHLVDEVLRRATEQVGAAVIPLRKEG